MGTQGFTFVAYQHLYFHSAMYMLPTDSSFVSKVDTVCNLNQIDWNLCFLFSLSVLIIWNAEEKNKLGSVRMSNQAAAWLKPTSQNWLRPHKLSCVPSVLFAFLQRMKWWSSNNPSRTLLTASCLHQLPCELENLAVLLAGFSFFNRILLQKEQWLLVSKAFFFFFLNQCNVGQASWAGIGKDK